MQFESQFHQQRQGSHLKHLLSSGFSIGSYMMTADEESNKQQQERNVHQ
jgi:hypothetical protein